MLQAQIVISIIDGQLQVQGPPDKILALGMLELAKKVIVDQPDDGSPRVLIAKGSLPNGRN